MFSGILVDSADVEFPGEVGEPALEFEQGLPGLGPLMGAEGTRLPGGEAGVDGVGPGPEEFGQCSPTAARARRSGTSGTGAVAQELFEGIHGHLPGGILGRALEAFDPLLLEPSSDRGGLVAEAP